MSQTSKAKAWIEAMRLRTLPVSCAGVFAGTACALAVGKFSLVPALICLVFAILAQIGSNFANEYYDFRNGLDRKGREGFRRGVTEGDISPDAMLHATYGVLGADALIGCSLMCYGGWWLIFVGIAIALFSVAYSTGPYPLSHHGLGDLAVVIFFGVVPVMFTSYLQAGAAGLVSIALPVSIGIGLMGANVLIVNNYRDRDDDAAVGKRTTVVIFGRRFMAMAYLLSGLIGIGLISIAFIGVLSAWWLFGVAAYICLHILLWNRIRHSEGSELNPMLGKTAMLLFAVAIVMLIACALN